MAADRLNAQAANAFLKTLEEPPARSVLILLTIEPQRLLETILSRCLRLNFFGDGARAPDPAQMEWLARFDALAAGGQKSLLSRYRLLDMLLQKLGEIRSHVEEALTARSPLQQHDEVEKELREKWEDELTAAIEAEYRRRRAEALLLMQWWLRDVWLYTLALPGRRTSPGGGQQFAEISRNSRHRRRRRAHHAATGIGKSADPGTNPAVAAHQRAGSLGPGSRPAQAPFLAGGEPAHAMKSAKQPTGTGFYALAFGLFLGLAILKFGNPVILDYKITPPASPAEFWADAWPTALGQLAFSAARPGGCRADLQPFPALAGNAPALAAAVALVRLATAFRPANGTDGDLTAITLCQFAGCLAGYFVGALVLGRERALALAPHRGAGGICFLSGPGNQPAIVRVPANPAGY